MAYFEKTRLTNAAGTVIDPATEQTLEEVNVAVSTGELVQAIEALRMLTQSLTRTVGMAMPDTTGSLRANITGGTLTTVSTVSAVTTVSGITNIGGLPANQQIPSLMLISAAGLRNNIIVS